MILTTDTFYAKSETITAGVLFCQWQDSEPAAIRVQKHKGKAAEYQPGAFYRRELPFILSLFESLPTAPSIIIIDGYVWLDTEHRKGLGAHLFGALKAGTSVIGVAKKPFAGSPHAIAVQRGVSKRPLFVTATGISREIAAEHIQRMAGGYRIPTLLKLADRLCRDG